MCYRFSRGDDILVESTDTDSFKLSWRGTAGFGRFHSVDKACYAEKMQADDLKSFLLFKGMDTASPKKHSEVRCLRVKKRSQKKPRTDSKV